MKPIEFKNEDKTRPNILQKQLIIEEHVSSSVKPLTQLKQEDLSNPNMDRPVQQNILPLNLDYYINNNDNKKPDLYNKKQYNIEFGAPLNSINSKELSENEKQWWALLQNPSFLMHKPPKPIFYQGLTDEILKLTDPYVKPHRYTLPPLNLPDSLPEKNQYYSPLWNSFHPIMIGYPINAIPNTVSKTIPNIVHNIEPNILHNISNPYLSPFIHSFHPLSYGYSSNPIPNTVPNIVHNTNPNMVPNTALNPIALPLIRPNLPPVIYNVPKLYNTQGQTMPVPPNGKNCFLGQNILNPPDAKSHPIITTHLDDLNAAVHPLLDAALAENIKMKRKTELSVVTKLSALKAQEHVAEMNRRTLYEKAREADADYIRKLNRELNLITEWKLANLSAEEAFHKLITHKRKLSEQEREVHRVKEAEDELYGQLLESQAQLALADMALIPRMPSEAALRQFLSVNTDLAEQYLAGNIANIIPADVNLL
ncbi:hypothetical protein O3M35_010452 [Rhynocoris fuscipes]|uniref:Uncharacterized protein n=1 Tax=Rhynocoris fuscipes TaxID=488301 RepID=A0AAW1D1Q4_9HEMI